MSSDTWDVCPKCYVDLRPLKKTSGLQIFEPNTSYEELALKAGAPPGALKPPGAIDHSSSFFSALFGKSATAPQPSKADPAAAASSDKKIPISASTIVARVLDASRIETERLQRVAPELPPAAPVPPAPIVETAHPPLAPPVEVALARTEPPPPPAIETSPPAVELPPSIPYVPAPPFEQPREDDVNLLFDESAHELASISEESTIELTSEALIDVDTNKLTVALFDFAYEVVQNPARESQLAEKITTSDERHVEAQDLSKELAHVEKRMSLPVFGLKSLQARVASSRQKESSEPVVELRLAKPGQQFLAALIDLLAIAALSVVVTAFAFMLTEKALFSRLTDIAEIAKPDAISFLSAALAAALVLLIAYPFGCLAMFRRTLGQYCCNLRVVTELGRRIRMAHSLVRSLAFPLSCLCFGYLPVLFTGRSLHDALARTKLCQDAKP